MDQLPQDINVPDHKRDITKPGNIVWLIENLGKRNARHPQFQVLMQTLLIHAGQKNLMPAKRLLAIENDLKVQSGVGHA